MSAIGHNGASTFSSDMGWVAIARSIRTHPLVGIHLFAKPMDANRGAVQPMAAFIDLIMECRYEDGFVLNGGRKMQVQRGQLVGAVSWLAARWNWTPMAVRVWLDKLEADMMISRFVPGASKDNKHVGRAATILSICNYEQYQQTTANKQQTQQQTNSNQTTNKQQQYKDNKGTREQGNNPSPLQGEGINIKSTRAENARAGKGSRRPVRADWLQADHPDGSQGLLFENGKLTALNGFAAALKEEFSGIDLAAVCNKAAADIAKMSNPTHLQCVTALRRHCQYDLDYRKRYGNSGTPARGPKRDLLAGLTPEQRAAAQQALASKRGAH